MTKPKRKRKKFISYTLRFVIAGTALYLAFRGENFTEVGRVLLRLDFKVVAAATALWLLSQFIFVSRWYLLLKVQSIVIGYWPAFRLHLLGVFYNNCLPSAVGGDLLRAWYVTTHTDKKVEAALSVFVDRAIGMFGLIVMALCSYWLIPVEGSSKSEGITYKINILERLAECKWYFVYAITFIALIFVFFSSNKKGRGLLRKWFGFVYLHGLASLQKVYKAILVYYNRKLSIIFALLLTFLCQSTFIVGLWLIGRNIGIDAHAKYYFIFFPVAWILGSLPLSIGGLGIWEGSLILMFGGVVTISSEHLSALALFHRLIWLFGSIPGVVIYLFGAHLPKDFSIDYNESMN